MAGTVPANGQSIWDYLVGAGFSDNAAAGIEGNIEAESGGNPEALESGQTGGGGLIQWTPISGYPGLVTGNTANDLVAQEKAILTYVQANGSVAAINNASSTPSAAATYFQDQYERPASDTASLGVRTSAATATLAASQSGSWPASTVPAGSGSSSGGTANSILGSAGAAAVNSVLSGFGITPSSIGDLLERGGLMILGVVAVIMGIKIFTSSSASGGSSSPSNSQNTTQARKQAVEGDAAKAAEKGPEVAEVAAVAA